ncbi:MAG: hypothetical protein Q8L53_10140 [Aestuariivirga sp.]|nr:hypothetical protein [Aestuariivirga sp.]
MAANETRARKYVMGWLGNNWLQLASIVAIPALTIWLGLIAQDRQTRQRDFELAVQIESQREKHGEKAKKWAEQEIARYTGTSQITLGSLPPELKKRLCFAPSAKSLEPFNYKKIVSVEDFENFVKEFKVGGVLMDGEDLIAKYETLLSEVKAGCEAVQQAQ